MNNYVQTRRQQERAEFLQARDEYQSRICNRELGQHSQEPTPSVEDGKGVLSMFRSMLNAVRSKQSRQDNRLLWRQKEELSEEYVTNGKAISK